MSRNMPFITGALFARVVAPAVAALMLASCQTTAEDSAAQGDAIPMESAGKPAAKPARPKDTPNGYTDPLVASAAGAGTRQDMNSTIPAGDGTIAAYAPSPSPANLGELTMQATTVNASRNSLFSAPAVAEGSLEPAPADTVMPADTQALADGGRSTSSSIVVPSELPTRQVNPMSKSLFSAELRQPRPAVMEDAALPPASSGEQPIYAAGEQPVYDNPASNAQSLVENEQPVAQASAATQADPAEPEQSKKRTWLASLKKMIGKKDD
ncbi:MAG: hypothetical protein K0M55_20130 [Rhizobium sp.]|nr:hypothetical protein [Rhizobium sp.]